jgi:hypothetical protein
MDYAGQHLVNQKLITQNQTEQLRVSFRLASPRIELPHGQRSILHSRYTITPLAENPVNFVNPV